MTSVTDYLKTLLRESRHDFDKEHSFCLAIDERRGASIGVTFNPVKHLIPSYVVTTADDEGNIETKKTCFFAQALDWYLRVDSSTVIGK